MFNNNITNRKIINQIFTVLEDLIKMRDENDNWEREEWRNDLPWPAEWDIDALRTELDETIVDSMTGYLNNKKYKTYALGFSQYDSEPGDMWDGVSVLKEYEDVFEWFMDYFDIENYQTIYIDEYEDWIEEHRYDLGLDDEDENEDEEDEDEDEE